MFERSGDVGGVNCCDIDWSMSTLLNNWLVSGVEYCAPRDAGLGCVAPMFEGIWLPSWADWKYCGHVLPSCIMPTFDGIDLTEGRGCCTLGPTLLWSTGCMLLAAGNPKIE